MRIARLAVLFCLDIVHYDGQTSAAFSGYAAPAGADSLDKAKAAFRRAWDAPPDVMTYDGGHRNGGSKMGGPHGEG